MDKVKLANHVKLCTKNLKSNGVICCAYCPFEEEIIKEYPILRTLFVLKRAHLTQKKANERKTKTT